MTCVGQHQSRPYFLKNNNTNMVSVGIPHALQDVGFELFDEASLMFNGDVLDSLDPALVSGSGITTTIVLTFWTTRQPYICWASWRM